MIAMETFEMTDRSKEHANSTVRSQKMGSTFGTHGIEIQIGHARELPLNASPHLYVV